MVAEESQVALPLCRLLLPLESQFESDSTVGAGAQVQGLDFLGNDEGFMARTGRGGQSLPSSYLASTRQGAQVAVTLASARHPGALCTLSRPVLACWLLLSCSVSVGHFAAPMDCNTPGIPVRYQLPELAPDSCPLVDDAINHILSSVAPFS